MTKKKPSIVDFPEEVTEANGNVVANCDHLDMSEPLI